MHHSKDWYKPIDESAIFWHAVGMVILIVIIIIPLAWMWDTYALGLLEADFGKSMAVIMSIFLFAIPLAIALSWAIMNHES
jgi:hypothetical protein